MRAWLLDPRRTDDVQRALAHRLDGALFLDLEKRLKAEASNGDSSAKLVVAGSEAEISIVGVLTEQFDWWLDYRCGGCTAYEDIRAALALAEADPNVKRIILSIDSHGGEVAGLYETVQAIEAVTKPIIARAACALSAAYALAAATNRIEARSNASEFGCLGVAIEYGFWADQEIVTIVNSESPDKRPDPRTPEGKKSIQAYLDSIYAWYADGIARGREVDRAVVDAEFGRGAVLMAPDAKKRGMIDGFSAQRTKANARGAGASASNQVTPPALGGTEGPATPSPSTTNEDTMNKQLIAQALGLSASATDEELESKIVALATSQKSTDGALAKLTALTGKDAEESVGVLLAWKQSHEAAPKAASDLADANAKIIKLEQKAELDTAIDAAKKANKLTPSEEKSLRDMFDAGDITLKGIKSNLEAKAAHPVLENAREPKEAPKSAEGGAATTAALTHNGKTWAQLTGTEKVALKRSDVDHYNAMRNQAIGAAA